MDRELILFYMPHFGGFHAAAWRQDDVPVHPAMDFESIRAQVQTAERGKFHAFFLGDTVSVGHVPLAALSRTADGTRFEPLTLLSALSCHTAQIGLLATASTTYNEPFHVARKFASLDHLSRGRAGWNVVTSATPGESRNFGQAELMDHALRYERSEEFFDVVSSLWDSWEDDAFLNDKEAGVFFDPAKVHELNHVGKFVSVAGPLNIARPVQGRPVIAQAGSSGPGRMFAARNADVVYTLQADLERAKEFYDDLKGRAVALGRSANEIKILPAIKLLVGRTRADVEERLARLDSMVNPETGMAFLTALVGPELGTADLDGPVPDVPETRLSSKGRQKYYLDLARKENLTVRELMYVVARRDTIAGTASDVVDMMEKWCEAGAADGFNITFADALESLEIFVDEVVPELQRRGLFHADYRGTTLRENLGLSRPDNSLVKSSVE